MSIWVLLAASVFLIGIGWYFIWTKNAHTPLVINLVVAPIALVYVIVAQKPIGWISLSVVWFAGSAIPILYDSWAGRKLTEEQKRMGPVNHF